MVEIDLLIAGRRLPMAKPLPPGDYFTIVSRGSRSAKGDVYAWSIRHPLPKIPIPLEEPDPDVVLDLGELFALAYERGRYERLIHYERPLDLPLHPDDKAWAEGHRPRSHCPLELMIALAMLHCGQVVPSLQSRV